MTQPDAPASSHPALAAPSPLNEAARRRWLLASRSIQGIGAAILAPATLALLSTSYAEGLERNRVLGWYGAVGGITASVGLVVGGIVADLVSWRAGFFINVPIGVLLIWGAQLVIAETPLQPGRVDGAGALLSTLGVVALVYGLVHAAEESWWHRGTAVPLLTGVVLLALFLQVERRAAQPILPLRLFARSERSGANAARAVHRRGHELLLHHAVPARRAGPARQLGGHRVFPSMLVNFLGALAAPRLSKRFGNGPGLAAAMAISLVGLAVLVMVFASAGAPAGLPAQVEQAQRIASALTGAAALLAAALLLVMAFVARSHRSPLPVHGTSPPCHTV